MRYLGLLSQIIAKKRLKSDIFYELLVISNSRHFKINKRIVRGKTLVFDIELIEFA
jgi:hypothetical protein